jgi:membrane protease YdiL (CAAX protease family)
MWANYSIKSLRAGGLGLWVVLAFIGAQIFSSLVLALLELIPLFKHLGQEPLTMLSAILSYGLTLGILLGVDRLFKRTWVQMKELGLSRLLNWSDIGLSILALLPYILISAVLAFVFSDLFHLIDIHQKQAIPFKGYMTHINYVISFFTLVILAPVAEELIFRGYFLGRLRKITRPEISVVVSALIFGSLHLPGITDAGAFQWQWGTAADTFALGLVLGSLRLVTGQIWAGILLHMFKNLAAYFFLFIYPMLTGTM